MTTPSDNQAALHRRRAKEHLDWAAAYDDIAEAIENLRDGATVEPGSEASRQYVTTLNDELTRAEDEARRLKVEAGRHAAAAAAWEEDTR